MTPLTITLPNCCICKKSSMTTSYTYKDKSGHVRIRQTPDGRFTPVTYYTEAYKKWATSAIQTLVTVKQDLTNKGIIFPLTDKMNLKVLFYYNANRAVDLNNLTQGIEDILAGHEKWFNLDKKYYQIIQDDNVRFIASLDGTRWIYDVVNPRTVITLSDFKMKEQE
jgi:hypothetical protein